MTSISAGSFILEPDNLWRRRLPRRYLDRAPGFGMDGGRQSFTIPSEDILVPVQSVAWHSDAIATVTDPWARVRALENAAIEAEVLFPTFGWSLFAIKDAAFRHACLRCYNDWLIDLCSASPWRFGFVPLIDDSEAGRAELSRCAARGAKAAVVGVGESPAGPVLETAATFDLPVVLARSGGKTPANDPSGFARESRALVLRHAGNGNRFVILGGEEPSGSAVLLLPAAGALPLSAWGLLGHSAASNGDPLFRRENAMTFFGLKVGA